VQTGGKPSDENLNGEKDDKKGQLTENVTEDRQANAKCDPGGERQ